MSTTFIKFDKNAFIKLDYWQWRKKNEAFGKELIPYAKTVVREIAKKAFSIVKGRTPGPGIQYDRSGASYRSTDLRPLWDMRHKKLQTREEFIMKNLYPNQDVVMYFEEGTKAHPIRPKRQGGFLNFYTSKGFVKTKVVQHPGTKAHRMIGGTMEWVEDKMSTYEHGVIELVKEIMDRSIK